MSRITATELNRARDVLQGEIRQSGRYPGRDRLAELLDIPVTRARKLLDRLTPELSVEPDQQKLFKLQRENAQLRKDLREQLEKNILEESLERFLSRASTISADPPDWVVKPPAKKAKIAVPTAFFSDPHWDEVVNPAEIEWMNGYNRQIALERTERFFKNTVRVGRDFLKGLDFDGIVLPLGGDLFSGQIHDELNETNEGPILDSMLVYLNPMTAGIKLLLGEYGRVLVVCVRGNHARMHKKPRAKGATRNNFEWFFYHLLAREFEGDKRVTFIIPDAADADWSIWGTRYRMTHGDQFRGGNGIAGALSPLMLGDARKKKRSQAAGRPYDYLIVGHWHQYFPRVKGMVVNGSLKGYDEYSYQSNFDFERPQQAFWLTDPEDGMTIMAPIHVMGKDEPWMKRREQNCPEWIAA